MSARKKQAAALADICFFQAIHEDSACVSRQWNASARESDVRRNSWVAAFAAALFGLWAKSRRPGFGSL